MPTVDCKYCSGNAYGGRICAACWPTSPEHTEINSAAYIMRDVRLDRRTRRGRTQYLRLHAGRYGHAVAILLALTDAPLDPDVAYERTRIAARYAALALDW